jgi:hypothetical protein
MKVVMVFALVNKQIAMILVVEEKQDLLLHLKMALYRSGTCLQIH